MKKIIISLLFLLVFYKLSFAGSISVPSFLTADNVTVAQLETMRSTFQGAINSADGGLLQSQTVTTEKLDTNANPENRWNEAFNDFVYTGLLPISYDTSTSAITTAGIAYIYGVRVVKDATPHTYTADKATYVDLSKNGTFTYSETELGSSAPITAGNSIRLAIVSADDTTITSISDKRVTTVALTTGEAMPATDTLADVDGNTKVQVEKNSNDNVIRFDTNGTERMTIGDTGIVNIVNLTASKPVFTDASKNLVSTGTLAIAQGGTGQVTSDTALNALLPSQTGNSGKFLTTNATNSSWGTVTTNTSGVQVFTSNGTFAAPAGVTKVFLSMCGGGGGGKDFNDVGFGGGGGASVINYPYTVVAGNNYTVVIGEGGAHGNPASNGGATSFDGTISVSGGTAGTDGGGGGGGAGGYSAVTDTGGTYIIAGGNGANGGGGGTPFGSGATYTGNGGINGNLYGGGGSGGKTDGTSYPGGNGAAGICVVMY